MDFDRYCETQCRSEAVTCRPRPQSYMYKQQNNSEAKTQQGTLVLMQDRVALLGTE